MDIPTQYQFEEVDSTADRALCVCAVDLESLFIGTMHGMYTLMTRPSRPSSPSGGAYVRLDQVLAHDTETMLVEWLNAFLTHTEDYGLYAPFAVDILRLSRRDTPEGRHLIVADAWIGEGNPSGAAIKAATFHDLEITEVEGEFRVTITFDV